MKRVYLTCFLLCSVMFLAGCDQHNDPNTGDNLVNLRGQAFFPVQLTTNKVAVANSPFQVLDFQKAANRQVVADGVTGADGSYDVVITQSKIVAVIVSGAVRVSGLISADASDEEKAGLLGKDFDGVTDVACEAGVTAILDGAVSPDAFDDERIANLEAGAAAIDGTFDHADPAAVSAAALQVRALTDNGDHLP